MTRDHRIDRAMRQLEAAELDAAVVAPSSDLTWLTGYDPPPLERLTALVLRPGADPVLLVPELERALAAEAGLERRAELRGWADGDDPYAAAARLLPSSGRVAIADRTWGVHLLGLQAAAPSVRFAPLSGVLPLLRAVKDPEEIGQLERAARGADDTFVALVREVFSGRTERQVAADLDRLLRSSGHREAGFAIVGGGPNSASPHHEPTDRAIGLGEGVVLDFGGPLDSGYWSDVSRTVCVGDPSEELAQVHGVVAAAQQAAFEAVRPGVPAEEIDRAARRVIEEAGYGERFLHRTGHGIGLEPHEPPYIVAGDRTELRPGMCFSIEPGIYLEGRFGVRIEDIVVVTDDGARRLNHAPRDLTRVA